MKFNNKKFIKAFNNHFGKPPYSQKLSESVGVKRPVMYKIHSNGNPGRDTFIILCHEMNIDIKTFFTK